MDEPVTILIVDDEPEARDLLILLMQKIGNIALAGTAENVDSALVQVIGKEPDLILLDIQMPGRNGFELVNSLRELGLKSGYIFVTAYDQYAIEAVRAAAFDYLLKPADFSDLSGKLEAARKRKDEQEERIRKAEAKLLLRRSGDI